VHLASGNPAKLCAGAIVADSTKFEIWQIVH
jgi:hypothetical protein